MNPRIRITALLLIVLGAVVLWLLAGGGIKPRSAAVAPADTNEYGAIGINLAANVDWGTAHIWTDATRDFRRWGQFGAPHLDNPNLTFTPDGYPLQDAEALSYFINYPNGIYKLTWSGASDVIVHSIGIESNIVRQGDSASADVIVNHENPDGLTGGMIYLGIRHNVAGDPVHDIHLWSPDYGPGSIFTSDFLRRVRPFACIRFMDWDFTNNSLQVNWSDRPNPRNMIQTGALPWETIAALANESNCDAWINIPAKANDDYVRQLATLFKTQLKPNLKLHIEYSNEVWNFQFQQYGYNLEQARKNPALTARDDYTRCAQQYALRAKQIGDIFRDVWGDQSSRLLPILGGQAANTYWHEAGLKYLHDHVGDPSRYFKELAIAPYVGDQAGPVPAGGWTLDSLFPALEHVVSTNMAQVTRDAKASADHWGLSLVAYEGGEDLLTTPSVSKALVSAAQTDARMYALYHQMVKTWHANGGGLFCEFSHIDPGWGLLASSAQAGSPKWDAVMDMLLPKGDANLDSKVDYADFLILQANWGRTNAYWEQGDFNGDHVVDRKDLDLLYPNLTGLTPEQQPTVDAFRAAHEK